MLDKKRISELLSVIYAVEIEKKFKRLEKQNLAILFVGSAIYPIAGTLLHFPIFLTCLGSIVAGIVIGKFCGYRIIKFFKEVEQFWKNHEVDKSQG